MNQHHERRQHSRRIGHGLVVLIDNRSHPVIDISVEGVKYQGNGSHVGATVSLKLARLDDMKDCVEGRVEVVDIDYATTRGRFIPTVGLLRYIIGHISKVTGSDPTYFK